MNREDFAREPCTCAACRQAGVSKLEQMRDPWSGAWLHGYDLKRWHDARAQFLALKERVKVKEF